MITNNLGYIFDCKKDDNGVVGIKEEFKFIYKGGIQSINAVFGIDINGKILCPAYYEKAVGLSSLRNFVKEATFSSDLDKFIRSNRAIYSLSSATYLICVMKARADRNTHVLLQDGFHVDFYVQKCTVPMDKINSSIEEFGVVCDIASPSTALNTFRVNGGILNGYSSLVFSQFSNLVSDNKREYIEKRLRSLG